MNLNKLLFFVLCSLFLVLCLACGGGNSGDNNSDDQPCFNCPDNGQEAGDEKDGGWLEGSDTTADGNTDQGEVEPYVCPEPDNLPEECVPAEAKKAFCSTDPPPSMCAYGFFSEEPCLTDSFCQEVPKDKWPPCVCWGFCEIQGLWDCTTYGRTDDYYSFPNISLNAHDSGGLCQISVYDGYFGTYENFLAKPGDPSPLDLSKCKSINNYECKGCGIGCVHCEVW